MINGRILKHLYETSYRLVKQQVDGVTHLDSFYQPPFGGNCMFWILGHIIVARCNFMMMLDVPSIWDMARCRRFIPGSEPYTGAEDGLLFEAMCADFDRSQELLLEAFDHLSAEKAQEVSGDKTIGEHLAFYGAHESLHAGQLEILRQVLDGRKAKI